MSHATAQLEHGREAFAGERWSRAREELLAADERSALGGDDLESLATAEYMLGHEREYRELLGRAYRAHLNSGEGMRALRSAFWIGINLAQKGQSAQAAGWLGRAGRLLEDEKEERVEHGYLLLPGVFQQDAAGDPEGAADTAGKAAAVGERFEDRDLFALATHDRGHRLIRLGRLEEGLPLLDEAMLAVSAEELSPIVSGIVYCGVILACRDAHEVRRAAEWTAALSDWCARQPDLVAFTGRCHVHRAEIMELRGAWDDALDAAGRAEQRALEADSPGAAGEACYQKGEIHRLRGDHSTAEEAYRKASRHGREPQPGLALLRTAQRNLDAASGAIRRALAEAGDAARRGDLLPAYVEVVLATGDLDSAREACEELSEIAAATPGREPGLIAAAAAYARGRIALVDGRAETALEELRGAVRAWQALDAPYQLARAREQIGLACRALGDEDTAGLELEGAAALFEELGAAADLSRLRPSDGRERDAKGLTKRELEVLREIAAGKTNKEIAAVLVVSERTVDRHASNIFAKIGVSTRAAATAFAFEHDLL